MTATTPMTPSDPDGWVCERAVALGRLSRADLGRARTEQAREMRRGRRPFVAQILVRDGKLAAADVLALLDEGGAPVYECPACGARLAGTQARAGLGCAACGAALEAPKAPSLSLFEVLAASSASELTVPLRAAGSASPPAALADGPLAGIERYEVQGELGRGGMGIVFRARQKDLDRPVALKVIRAGPGVKPVSIERFLREGRAAAAIEHPGIVRVFDIGAHRRLLYLAMELIDGETLAQALERGPLPWARAVEIAVAVLEAIAFAHARGFVHRDLKPANILIERATGRPRLIDFGLTKDLGGPASRGAAGEAQASLRAAVGVDAEGGDGHLTVAGQLVGTPFYLSPEQVARGSRSAGPESDIWAMGAILHEMLTGRRPFVGETAVEVCARILREAPPAPDRLVPDVPREVAAACQKALEKDAARRFPTPEAFAAALAARPLAAAAAAAPATAPSGRLRPKSTERRRPTSGPRPAAERLKSLAPFLVAGVGVVVALAILIGSGRGGAPREAERKTETRAPQPRTAGRADPDTETSRTPARERDTRIAEVPEGRGLLKPGPSVPSVPSVISVSQEKPPSQVPTSPPAPEPPAVVAAPPPEEPVPVVAEAPPALALAPVVDLRPPDPTSRALLADRRRAARLLFVVGLDDADASRALPALAAALEDGEPLVRSLAVRGLARRGLAELAAAGAAPLADRLERAALKPGTPVLVRDAALELARRLREGVEPEPEPEAGGDRRGPTTGVDPVERAATAAREIAKALEDAERRGLEVAIVLDVTDSMLDEVEGLRRSGGEIGALVEALVGARARLGLVTYGDRALAVFPLAPTARFGEAAAAVKLESDPANKTIEEAVEAGLEAAVRRPEMGWKRPARRHIVVFGDAPPAAADLSKATDLARAARGAGFRVHALIAEPPARYKAAADPVPALTRIATEGGGRAVECPAGRDATPALAALTLGLPERVEELEKLLGALREVSPAP